MSLPARALAKAIRAAFGTFPGLIGIEPLARRDWASATFTGARHEVRIVLDGPGAEAAADRFLAGLDDHDFALRDHFVASAALADSRRAPGGVELRIELLIVAAD